MAKKKTTAEAAIVPAEMPVSLPANSGGGTDIVSHAAAERAAMTPQERIKENEDLVRVLAPEIQREHLANIQGKDYMCVGGGIAIANSMGYAISVGTVTFDKDQGIYQATAYMTNGLSKEVIASAVGYVGDDEDRWMNGPKAARNSMVQTRAEAKLCRINFGHLYTLLGAASATPAEEMTMVQQPVQHRPQRSTPPPAARPPAAAPSAPAAQGATRDSDGGTHRMQIVKCAPATKRDGSIVQGTKKNGEAWMKYRITNSDNEWFDTFNNYGEVDAAEDAMKNHGGIAMVTWDRSEYGKNVAERGIVPGEPTNATPAVEAETVPAVPEDEIPF